MNPTRPTLSLTRAPALALALSIPLAGGAGAQAEPAPAPETRVRVMTFNIRYGTARDGANHWRNRQDLVVRTIRAFSPDVLGVQEALDFQVRHLGDALAGRYLVVGQGREGGTQGEYACLLIDRARFEVTRSGDFWLSDTPSAVASVGWDAALPRICSWAVLRDRRTDARFCVLGTHFDHRGARAREASARLITERLRELAGLPVIVLGDLNAGEDSAPLDALRGAGLADSFRSLHSDADRVGTFNGFTGRDDGAKIDYVLCGEHWRVLAAGIDQTAEDGRFPSDHFPVTAELALDGQEPPKLVPVLDSGFWHITGPPELGELAGPKQETVDHGIFQSTDGKWHVWACVRGTAIGRLLFRWEGDALEQRDWRPGGVAQRADPAAGESLDDWGGKEWIQAPFVIVRDERFHMFYGGHRSETGACQICLATSDDGREFTRHRDARGMSRVFVGPGEARDPMVLALGGRYLCYYTGHDEGQRAPGKIYCRTSQGLREWSEPVAVNWGGSAGSGNWSAECPFVVERDGLYYLFRTSSYREPLTHVYRSADPLDFGRGDDSKKIGTLAVAAPEVVERGLDTFIGSVHDLTGGIQLARLRFVAEDGSPR